MKENFCIIIFQQEEKSQRHWKTFVLETKNHGHGILKQKTMDMVSCSYFPSGYDLIHQFSYIVQRHR